MKNKFCPLLLTVLLGGVALAKAVIINPESFGQTEAQVSSLEPGSAYSFSDRAIFPVGDHPKKFEGQTQTAASNDVYGSIATSNATWTLESKQNSAVYSGTYTLDATGRKYSNASLVSELHFTLLESASYSLAATFDGFFVPTGFSSAAMNASLRRLNPPSGSEFSTGLGDRNVAGGTFQLGGGEPLTGTLGPGDYIFEFSNYLINEFVSGSPDVVSSGTGNGHFELSLDRLHPGGNPHVPEAGSTLAMLGMALTALVGMIRYRRD